MAEQLSSKFLGLISNIVKYIDETDREQNNNTQVKAEDGAKNEIPKA